MARTVVEFGEEVLSRHPIFHRLDPEDMIKSAVENPEVITGFGPPDSNLRA